MAYKKGETYVQKTVKNSLQIAQTNTEVCQSYSEKVISLHTLCVNCWYIKSDMKYDAPCLQVKKVVIVVHKLSLFHISVLLQ